MNNGNTVNEKGSIEKVFIAKIEGHLYKYYWEKLGLKDWENRIHDRIAEVPQNERFLKTLESFIGDLRDKRVLIVGSGWGGACVAAKNLGADEVIGIDIDTEANEIANLRMQLAGYTGCCLPGAAEHIPFQDDYFDYVHCFTVLEHVSDIQLSLLEMIRVAGVNGYVFIQSPNYLRPIERHYKVPYVPLMPKKLAKIYLRLLKRPPGFIDSINYIWPRKIRNFLNSIQGIEVEQIADKYKIQFHSLMTSDERHTSLSKSDTSQKHNERPSRNAFGKTLTIFYKMWDRVFGTREIYFLIHKTRVGQ